MQTTTDNDNYGQENQPRRRRGRPSKFTPELREEILTAIRDGGCTYADACLRVGISTKAHSNCGNRRAREQARGHFCDFWMN